MIPANRQMGGFQAGLLWDNTLDWQPDAHHSGMNENIPGVRKRLPAEVPRTVLECVTFLKNFDVTDAINSGKVNDSDTLFQEFRSIFKACLVWNREENHITSERSHHAR